MTTTAPTLTGQPHALAMDILSVEAQDLAHRQLRLDRAARRAATQPPSKYDPADVARTEAAAALNRDRHARICESIRALESDAAARAAEQLARKEELPEAAAEAIMKSFIVRPDALEILKWDYLGNDSWNVEAKVTYAGIHTPIPRAFLLVRTADYLLLVNP